MVQIRLANITGLDINNAQHSVAVDEALHGIEDTEAFLEYCRDKKEGITFSAKPERLDTLATRYKKLQAAAKLPTDLADSFSTVLCEKVESCRVYIKNEIEVGNDRPFSRLRTDGVPFFTLKELKALAELGSPSHIIALAEENTLKDELVKLFISKFAIKSKYELLSDNQKKVHALAQGVAK